MTYAFARRFTTSSMKLGIGGGNPCTDPERRRVYAWSAEDFDAAKRAAYQLNVPLLDLLAVFSIETGGTFNPGIVNCWPDGETCCGAVGLNQITPPNAAAMGISNETRLSLMDMTPAEQMPYVVRSFQAAMAGKWKAGAWPKSDDVTLYQVNLAPGTVPNEVLYSAPSTNYQANKGLDVDGDGRITRSDLRTVIDKHKTSQRTRSMYQQATGELPPEGSSRSRSRVGTIAMAGAALAAAYWLTMGSGYRYTRTVLPLEGSV
jgi:hypothetical protein